MPVKKRSNIKDTGKVGRKDRYPSDYGVRDEEDAKSEKAKDKSWAPGDKG